MFKFLFLFSCLFLTGCLTRPSESGTFEDAPDNYEKFYNRKPTDINIIHSLLIKSPSVTDNEWAFFIQISPDKVTETWPEHEHLRKVNELDANLKLDWNYECIAEGELPKWFLPKKLSEYEIYFHPDGEFRFFIDKETRELFWSDCTK